MAKIPQTFAQWIEQHRRQLQRGLWLERLGDWLAIGLLVFGGLTLLTKLFLPALWPHIFWGLAAALPVIAILAWKQRPDAWTSAATVAWLDHRLAADGLLMTMHETGHSAWASQLDQQLPDWRRKWLRIRPTRFARLLLIPLVFATASCFVPLRQTVADPMVPQTVGDSATERLQQSLDWLNEVHVLTPEESEELAEEIEQLTADVKKTGLTHEKWEAIDNLRRRLQRRLESAQLSVARGTRAAQELRDSGQNGNQTLTAEQQETAEEELIETLQKRQERGALGQGEFTQKQKDELQRLIQNQQLPQGLSDSQRQDMLNQLQDFLKRESERLEQARRKLAATQPGDLSAGENGEFSDLLERMQQGGQVAGQQPGQGGNAPGPGEAPLDWGTESAAREAKFKQVALPPGAQDEPGSDVVGVTKAAPTVDPQNTAPRSTARNTDAATGQETRQRALRPRHRQIIRKYFRD